MKKSIPIRIAGIDDATKCPCIGSIFLAGVLADKKTISYWKKLGVKDSKLITSKKRFKLARIIKETALSYSIHEITPHMIDDKSFNLNEWEMLTVFKIVMDLQQDYTLGDVHVDNWEVTEGWFRKRFFKLLEHESLNKSREKNIYLEKEQLSSVYFLPEHRADELYTIVGAASILAKTSSDLQYQEYRQIYGDFGSGSPADPKTRLFVWQNRLKPLPIIRTSWNTFKTLFALKNIEDDVVYARVQKNTLLKLSNDS